MVVFLQKNNEVVELYTGSDKTHVGIIFSDAKNRWVYEATPAEVRRVALAHYLGESAEQEVEDVD